jgi:hypothetical protein
MQLDFQPDLGRGGQMRRVTAQPVTQIDHRMGAVAGEPAASRDPRLRMRKACPGPR